MIRSGTRKASSLSGRTPSGPGTLSSQLRPATKTSSSEKPSVTSARRQVVLRAQEGARGRDALICTFSCSAASTRSSKSVIVTLTSGAVPRFPSSSPLRLAARRATNRPRKPTPDPSSRTVPPLASGRSACGSARTSSASRSEAPHVRRPVVPAWIVFCSSCSVTASGWTGGGDEGASVGVRARAGEGKKKVLKDAVGGAAPVNGEASDDDPLAWMVSR